MLYHCTKRWSSYTPSWGLVSVIVSACFWLVLVLLCPVGKCMSVVCSSYRVQIAIPEYMPQHVCNLHVCNGQCLLRAGAPHSAAAR